MDSTHGIRVVLRYVKAGVLYTGLVLFFLGATIIPTLVIGELDLLYRLGLWVFMLGALLLVMRRQRSTPLFTTPKTAFGRVFSEFRRVWSANHLFLGLVTVPLAGMVVLGSRYMKSLALPPTVSLSVAIAAALPLIWIYSTAHLLAHDTTDNATSTPLRNALKSASSRFGVILLGAVPCVLIRESPSIFQLIGAPATIILLVFLIGNVVGSALLPYISILTIEGKNPIDALKRTIELGRGHWRLMLVCHMLIGVTSAILLLIMTSVIEGLVYISDLRVFIPLDPVVSRLASFGFVGTMVGAYGIFISFVGALAVSVPLATYRMLVRESSP